MSKLLQIGDRVQFNWGNKAAGTQMELPKSGVIVDILRWSADKTRYGVKVDGGVHTWDVWESYEIWKV